MKIKKFRGVLLFLFVFFIASHSYPEMEIRIPAGTKMLIYIKDIKNLEANLEKSGMLKLPSDYRDYLIDYMKDKEPGLQMYQEFRNLEAGDFIKTMVGETLFLNVMNDNLIVIKLDKRSAYFTALMNVFKVKGRFNGFFVEFMGDNAVLSRNQSMISLYKKSGVRMDDGVLKNQDFKNSDIVFYKTGKTILHPFADPFIVKDANEKSFSLGVNFLKKSLVLYTKPSLFEYSGQRMKNPGQLVPAAVLVFSDSLQNPYDIFLRIFGESNLGEYKNDFKKLFDNQVSFAVASFSPEIKPSFLVVLKPQNNKMDEAEKFIVRFFKEAVGEKDWEKKKKGLFNSAYAKNSPYCYYTGAGLIALSDNEADLNNSMNIINKKSLSVWDDRDNAQIKDKNDKQAALYINLSALANSVYKSMLKKMDLTSSEKADIKAYMKSVKDMGSLSGYGEYRKDLNYYYFTVKGSSKEK